MIARRASSFDKALARVCVSCPVCRRARQRQRGMAFGLVKQVEANLKASLDETEAFRLFYLRQNLDRLL